jgi:hypothetical protein
MAVDVVMAAEWSEIISSSSAVFGPRVIVIEV